MSYRAPPKAFTIRRQAPVSWFNINQLAATAAKTIAATIVGPMSGRRELMSALDPPDDKRNGYIDLGGYGGKAGSPLWLDYLADTGDGWNATTSVAWLVGRDSLLINRSGKPTPQPVPTGQGELDLEESDDNFVLPRGFMMIAGGDEVYPTASTENYQLRLVQPFMCARYSQASPRQILAIPGNHDWYDGLTAFIRLFCQRWDARRWIGAWRAQQWRSYFAVKLPYGWWMWGIDAALGDDLDPPQIDYFRDVAKSLAKGDRVILCVPAPHWPMGRSDGRNTAATTREMDDKLAIFQRLTTANDADGIKLILTGDLHYYAHFQSISAPGPTDDHEDRNHYVICGGGGAFGLGTICTPGQPVHVGSDRAEPVPGGLFPSRQDSVRLRRGLWRFPLRNPGFCGLLMALQFIALWLISSLRPPQGAQSSWIDYAMSHSLGAFLWEVLKVLPYPSLLLGTAAFCAGFIGFAISGCRQEGSRLMAGLAGAAHAFAQIAGSISLVWLTSQVVQAALGQSINGFMLTMITVIASAPVLFVWCGLLFGLYLFAGHKFLKLHDQEVFSAQGIEDFKSFLKLRVDPEGITIFPIGLTRVARAWRPAPTVKVQPGGLTRSGLLARTAAVETPEGCVRVVDPVEELAPHLIEAPFRIAGRSQSSGDQQA